MEMCTFAVENGYAEGILRGLRSSFLTEQQYMQVKNCANIGQLRSVHLLIFSSQKTQTMDRICSTNLAICPFLFSRPDLRRKLEIKQITSDAIVQVSSWSFWISSASSIRSIMLSISQRESKIKLTTIFLWPIQILWDTSLKLKILRSQRETTILDSTEMYSSTPLSVPTS